MYIQVPKPLDSGRGSFFAVDRRANRSFTGVSSTVRSAAQPSSPCLRPAASSGLPVLNGNFCNDSCVDGTSPSWENRTVAAAIEAHRAEQFVQHTRRYGPYTSPRPTPSPRPNSSPRPASSRRGLAKYAGM